MVYCNSVPALEALDQLASFAAVKRQGHGERVS
jgi:hypothetical protein